MNWPFRKRTISDSARDLANLGHQQQHDRVKAVARAMRKQLGLPPHEALQ